MGLLDFFRWSKAESRSSLQNPSDWMYSWLGAKPTNSGVSITQESALRHAGVYACVKILAESIASLPVGLFSKVNNTINELTRDSRHVLISAEPSPLYTSYDFRCVAMLHIGLNGNFYAKIIRDGNRRPIEFRIYPDPNQVTPELDPEGQLWYRVPDEKLPIRPNNIIHLKGLSSNGLIGKSPIELFRENIGLGIATVETQGSIWKNGTLISGYLKHPGKLTPGQVSELRETWKSRHGGGKNAGTTPVLESGMEFIPLTLKPADAMFIETAKLSLHDICRFYRVPLHMVGDLDRSTNNNIEHQSLEFVRDTVRPYLKNWEQELNRKLLFDTEKGRLYFHFNVDGLLRGDTKSRGEFFTRALGSTNNPGWMSRNEVRALENLNPIPDGDQIFTPQLNQTNEQINTGDDSSDNGTQEIPSAGN